MIILVSGKSGSGKDTFGGVATERGFDRCSAGDVCKHEVASFLNSLYIPYNYVNLFGTQEEKLVHCFDSTDRVFDEFPYELRKLIIDATDTRPTASVTFRDVLGAWAKWKNGKDPFHFVRQMFETMDPLQDYVMTDFRFMNELMFLRERAEVVTVRIDRPETDALIPVHSIDNNLDGVKLWDYRIYNNASLSYFTRSCEAVMSDIVENIL